jgi:MFS family permease
MMKDKIYTPWLAVLSASLFFFYQFAQMNIINPLAPYLMKSFAIDATHLGKLSAFYFLATILFLLPAGQILDRFSTRKVILIVLTISITGTFLFAFATTYRIACVTRFIMGIGDAFCYLSTIRIASRWFYNKKLALASGVVTTMGMTGAMLAQTPLSLLIHYTGNWRCAIMIDGAIGIVFWIIIFIAVKDPLSEKIKSFQFSAYWMSLQKGYGKVSNWICGCYACLINLSIILLGGDGFGSLYLQQVKHFSTLEASYPPTTLFLGMAIGSPLMGWISDKLSRRKLPMQISAMISAGLVLLIIYLSASLPIYIILFFLLGFISSASIICYPLVTENNPRALTGTCISVISFVALSGGAIFPPLFGSFLDKDLDFKIMDHIHVYSLTDYHQAMLIMPLALLAALITTFFIPETYCKSLPK